MNNKNSLSVLSPAKINLYLEVTGKRKDGYHNLATIFQMINLYDNLTFSPRTDGKIKVTCSNRKIKEKDNLVYKAAKSLWKKGLPGISIKIDKKIPVGAGLGGGSSNGATALYILNKIWKLGKTNAELRKIGKKLGADVAFFLYDTKAWATGIGDKLKPLPEMEKFHIVIVKPKISISTVEIFKSFKMELTTKKESSKIPAKGKCLILVEDTIDFLRNDLESTVFERYPNLLKVRNAIKKTGSKGVMLSGSGSVMFGIYRNLTKARLAYAEIANLGWFCELTEPLATMNHLPEVVEWD